MNKVDNWFTANYPRYETSKKTVGIDLLTIIRLLDKNFKNMFSLLRFPPVQIRSQYHFDSVPYACKRALQEVC